jgi:hypothetical protein
LIKIYFRGLASTAQDQRTASRFLLHEGYQDIKDRDDRNDLALVFFEGGLPAGMQPALLPFNQPSLSAKESLWVAGFGHSNLGQLRKISLSLWQFSKGRTLFWLNQVKGQGACHGDSGGPAYLPRNGHLYVVGVTSYGYTTSCEQFSIYTHLEPYLPWLQTYLPKP